MFPQFFFIIFLCVIYSHHILCHAFVVFLSVSFCSFAQCKLERIHKNVPFCLLALHECTFSKENYDDSSSYAFSHFYFHFSNATWCALKLSFALVLASCAYIIFFVSSFLSADFLLIHFEALKEWKVSFFLFFFASNKSKF